MRILLILKKLASFIIVLIAFARCENVQQLSGKTEKIISYNQGKILEKVEIQTDVDNAKFVLKDGVPYLDIANVGLVFNPSGAGVYALQYANKNTYSEKYVEPNEKLFFHSVKSLEKKLTIIDNDSAVWLYDFDNTYNNVYIKAPWYSSFAQAIGIEVFVTAYEKTKDTKYLELAKRVAKPLLTPMSQNGLLFEENNDVWFEEIPLKENSTHILNAQLRTLIALDMLYNMTKEGKYKRYFDQGLATLKKWLPKYDTGHWLRYDLNPKTKQIFRLTNPYGFKTAPLEIDNISVLDENKNVLFSEDVGDKDDFDSNKSIYLSGIHWESDYVENNASYRTIKSIYPTPFKEEFDSQMLKAPYTFIYVNFPSTKYQKFYLKISYKDKTKGNLILQKRSIIPKIKFVDVNNGLFLMKGDNKKRSLIVPITDNQFGFYTGLSYAQKHYLYLRKLLQITDDREIKQWANVAKAYINTIEYNTDKNVTLPKVVLPKQTPMLPLLSFDKYNVIRQHQPSKKTKFIKGIYDHKSEGGKPVYSPFIIASQALNVPILNITKDKYKNIPKKYFDKYNFLTFNNQNKKSSEPALTWLKDNAHKYNDSLFWTFDFPNSYNDLQQESGWASAFGQAYVIKAFLENNITDYALKGANAYKYVIGKGGVSSFDKSGNIWFEEVPNKTHILNAHLISENILLDNLGTFHSKEINKISKNGLKSLEKYLNEFDTGYWSKYDQNPKKELLFQFDWIKGKKSPLLDEICLISTLSHTKTCLDIGAIQDANTSNKISGLDWLARNKIDGKTVRSFQNGYKKRNQKVQRGIQHNVFARLCLPDREFEDYWKITPYYLSIKYKDIENGQFDIKIRSIRGGGFLEFMPLTSSNILTVGDNTWKEHIIPLKTHDMGWSMGVDYHKYHIKQLEGLSEKTDNTILTQTTDRWKYYLDLYELRQTPIVEPKKIYFHQLGEYNITSNLKYYRGYELENSLDKDTKNNYVASFKNIPLPHSLDINLPNSIFLNNVQLIWESKQNSAKEYIIYAYHKNKLVHEQSINNLDSNNTIYVDKLCDKLIIKINKYNGQKRLLLRGIRIYGK